MSLLPLPEVSQRRDAARRYSLLYTSPYYLLNGIIILIRMLSLCLCYKLGEINFGKILLHISHCVFHCILIPTIILIVCVLISKIIVHFYHMITTAKKESFKYIFDLCAGGSHVVSLTHGMGLIPRQQCRKAPASVAEKRTHS